MTSSIGQQQNPQHQAIPAAGGGAVCALPPAGWACSRAAGHEGPCAASPISEPAHGPSSASEPSSAPAEPRDYGFNKAEEFDLALPSGSFVRLRKLSKNQVLQLNLIEVLDGFTPELLADIRNEDQDKADEAAVKALTDPQRSGKIFGPVDRVVAASVVEPKVVLDGETTADGKVVNVNDIELEDKLAIFSAAFGEQLAALKSVREQPEAGLRDLPAVQGVQPASE